MNEELKPLGRTLQRIDRCPGKVATPGTECCVATGRPALRSVHRECNCLVIEPRKHSRWERPSYAKADAAPACRTA